MIKFFRKIRQNLLMQNNNVRYIKYAIGEIVLVVIGILFALQINNWNLDRIERKNEGIILMDLKVEFEENLRDAERVFEGNSGIYNAISAIQKKIAIKDYDQNELDSLMYFVFDWFDYTPKPGASNNLINSGNLNLITNKELRKLLTLWSGVDAELEDDEALAVRYSHDVIIPFLAEHFPIGNLEKFDFDIVFYAREPMEEFEYTPETSLPYDVEGFMQNKTFQSHIAVKKIYARHNAMECLNVVKTCRDILNLIDTELNDK